MAVAPAGLRWHEEVTSASPVPADAAWPRPTRPRMASSGLRCGKERRRRWQYRFSCGMIPGAGTAQQRAAGGFDVGEDFARDVLTRNSDHSDAALTRRLCEGSASLLEWLGDRCGIALELVPTAYDRGHTRLHLHAPAARSGRPLVQALLRSLDRHGISLHRATPVLQLWTDAAGAVLGVQVKRPRKAPSNVRCHKLILATGGFGANSAAVTQHCRAAEGLRYAGHPGSGGEALVWAADVGAATRDLDAYDAHASVAVGSNLLIPWIVITAGALVVNQRGERFADETCGPAAMVPRVLAQPGQVAYESSMAASPKRWRLLMPGLPTKSFHGWRGAPTTSRGWQNSSKSIRRHWCKQWLPTTPRSPAVQRLRAHGFRRAARRAVVRALGWLRRCSNTQGGLFHRSERTRSARRWRSLSRTSTPAAAQPSACPRPVATATARQRPPVRPGGADRRGNKRHTSPGTSASTPETCTSAEGEGGPGAVT